MSKYRSLGAYLRAQGSPRVAMTFAAIERVLGMQLPPSAARHRAWWSNNPTNNVATKEWLDAGYVTEQVDIVNRRLVFRRLGSLQVAEPVAPAWKESRKAMGEGEAPKTHHPLFGALKGTVYIPPGVDLTEPADPEWGKIWDEGD